MAMRPATSADRYFRLKADGVSGQDAAYVSSFNRDVARLAGVPVAELPVAPVRSWESYPFAVSADHRGFTMAANSLLVLIKGCARSVGLSNNYVPQLQV